MVGGIEPLHSRSERPEADEAALKTSLDRYVRFLIALRTIMDRASDGEVGPWSEHATREFAAALDAVSLPVGGFVMGDLNRTGSLGRDDVFSAHIRDQRPQGVSIKGFIGNDAAAFAAFQQVGSHFAMMNLAGVRRRRRGRPCMFVSTEKKHFIFNPLSAQSGLGASILRGEGASTARNNQVLHQNGCPKRSVLISRKARRSLLSMTISH